MTKLASESGSMTATTRTSGNSVGDLCQRCTRETEKDKQRTRDLGNEGIDVAEVVGLAVVGNRELSVGSLGSAVTVGEIVDDDLDELLLTGGLLDGGRISELVAELRDLGDGICRTFSYVDVEEVPVFTHQTR